MVQAVYALKWTEHEFGQRPDGLTLHATMAEAIKFKAQHQGGDRDQFWTATEPTLMEVDRKIARMVEKKGTIWGNATGWTVDPLYIERAQAAVFD